MEQNNVQNVVDKQNLNSTENTDTHTVEKNEGAFKVFQTKEDYQKAVDSLISSKLPKKEELDEFKKWQESKKTEAEKQTELTQTLTDTKNENISLKQENQILKSGVNIDDVDYILFKVSKMEGEFEDNLKDFLKENPKYLQTTEVTNTSKEDTGVAVTKNNEKTESGVTAILKEKHPELFN